MSFKALKWSPSLVNPIILHGVLGPLTVDIEFYPNRETKGHAHFRVVLRRYGELIDTSDCFTWTGCIEYLIENDVTLEELSQQ